MWIFKVWRSGQSWEFWGKAFHSVEVGDRTPQFSAWCGKVGRERSGRRSDIVGKRAWILEAAPHSCFSNRKENLKVGRKWHGLTSDCGWKSSQFERLRDKTTAGKGFDNGCDERGGSGAAGFHLSHEGVS